MLTTKLKKLQYLALAIFLAFGFAACSDDDDGTTNGTDNGNGGENGANMAQAFVMFESNVDGEPLQFYEAYTNRLGHSYTIEEVQFYISDVAMLNANGDTIPIKEVELMNLDVNFEIEANLEPGNYRELIIGFGLNPDQNAQDPSSFPNDHPLSIRTNMYWSWQDGYIFTKIDGKRTPEAGDEIVPNETMFYHTGLDDLYRKISLPIELDAQAGATHELVFDFNMQDLFDKVHEIELSERFGTHTTGSERAFELAEDVTENFVEGMKAGFSVRK